MPKVSIIIPAFNSRKFIGQTIESVMAQTETDWELIIVDDGSTDSTPEVIEIYTKIDERIALVRQENQGEAIARNVGIEVSDICSQYILFLDNDDILLPDALRILLKGIENKPNAVGINGKYLLIDVNQKEIEFEEFYTKRFNMRKGHPVVNKPDQPNDFSSFTFANAIATPGQALIKREALEKVGGFDSTTMPSDDLDMWLRLTTLGDILFLDKVVLYWRRHETNLSLKRVEVEASTDKIYKKFMQKKDLPVHLRRSLVRGLYWRKFQTCKFYWDWAKENLKGNHCLPALKQLRHCLICFGKFVTGYIKYELLNL